MRNLLLAATVFIIGACTSGGIPAQPKEAEAPSTAGPRFGRIVKLYEVLDQDTRARVGYVELTRYDNGQQIYWVRDKERSEKLGYILTNNRAYRYAWVAGKRSPKPEFIGADTISANSRRILRHDRPVELQATSLRALADEIQPKQTSARAGAEAAGSDEG